MPLTQSHLPGIVAAVKSLHQAITTAPTAINNRDSEAIAGASAIAKAVFHLVKLLTPSNPNPINSFTYRNDLYNTALPPRTERSLQNLYEAVCQDSFFQMLPYDADYRPLPSDRRTKWLVLLDDTLLQMGEQSDRFADFTPLKRKLLLALDGKGKVTILSAFKAVRKIQRMDKTDRASFLALIRRTDDDVGKKGYMIKLEGNTIELQVIPPRPSTSR